MTQKEHTNLFNLLFQGMEIINQDILQIEKNMKNLVKQSGPLETQLSALLQSLPKPNVTLPMEME